MSNEWHLNALAEQFANLLDDELSLLDLRRRQLEGMAQAVAQRDEGRLELLLEEVERTQPLQTATDRRMEALRNALASAWACPAGQVRLSRLIRMLPSPWRDDLERRRQNVIQATHAVRRQHLRTAILLTEFARVNRLLLEALLPKCQEVTTYGASGPNAWRSHPGLVDQEL